MTTAVLILAGGESRRMGQDKAALLRPDGRTQLQFTSDVARSLQPQRVLISSNLRRGIDGTEELADQYLQAGPLAGIERAVATLSDGDLLLVLPCDLPLLTSDILEPLLNAAPASYDRRWLPCTLRITQSLRDYLLQALTAPGNQRSVRELLAQQQATALPLSMSDALQNTNSPDDWQRLFGAN